MPPFNVALNFFTNFGISGKNFFDISVEIRFSAFGRSSVLVSSRRRRRRVGVGVGCHLASALAFKKEVNTGNKNGTERTPEFVSSTEKVRETEGALSLVLRRRFQKIWKRTNDQKSSLSRLKFVATFSCFEPDSVTSSLSMKPREEPVIHSSKSSLPSSFKLKVDWHVRLSDANLQCGANLEPS